MINIYIVVGIDKVEDIIKFIFDGLYVKKLGGGFVNFIIGEFNFFV